jgi:hypothetical protein
MVALPSKENLNRVQPQTPAPQNQVIVPDLTKGAKAMNSIAEGLQDSGRGAMQFKLSKDRSNYLAAKSRLTSEIINAQTELEKDPDYSTYGARLKERITKFKENDPVFKDKGFLGNSYQDELNAESNILESRAYESLANIAAKKEADQSRAELLTTIDNNSSTLLAARDESTRADILRTTNELIDTKALNNHIDAETAVKLKRNFAENYATQRASLLPVNQQMALIKPTKNKDGSISFPQTGTWADAIPSEAKIRIYQNAQAEYRTQITSQIGDVQQAANLGLKIPKEKIINLSNQAAAAGMASQAAALRSYAAVQEDADKFATMSIAQQQTALNNLKTDIEGGNLKQVDRYKAFQNILETKAKTLKEDPYSYYEAHGVINTPTPIDITNPASIAQNLQLRRVENQKVKQVEGQNFEMPILTKSEIDQLKNINQTGSAKDVATVLNNIGQNLTPIERQTLARQLNKEQSPTLAIAMSMNNQKDSFDLIAGSKLEANVALASLKRDISSKLDKLVIDPEKNEMIKSAVVDAYKKLALDAGDSNKEVDNSLLDQAIEKVAGRAVEISPRGKKSKVFAYRDNSGNFVSENDLEDTFNSISDNVLKQTNGSLPFLPSGDIVTAKEILKDTNFITVGNGQYVPYYEGIGYLTGQDGRPYVIDAKKIKDITGNVPAPSSTKEAILTGSQLRFAQPEQKIVDDALKGYPAIKRVINENNTVISLANPDRLKQLKNAGGQNRMMETWFPNDPGAENFKNPNPGKFTFEFYNKDSFDDPKIKKAAIFLDSLHVMREDPGFESLRDEFNNNWKPSELNFIKKKYEKESRNGESLDQYINRTVTDAYLRGALNPLSDEVLKSGKYKDEFAQLYRGQIKNENGKTADPYSPKQREIIRKMENYLKKK